jgi:hypothetical protein
MTDARAIEPDARGGRLGAALAAALVSADAPELRLIHGWLDSWAGIGLIVVGMAHQGFTVSWASTALAGGSRCSSTGAAGMSRSRHQAPRRSRRRRGRCRGRRGRHHVVS